MMTTPELILALKAHLESLALARRVVLSELIERDLSDLPKDTPLPAIALKDGDEEEPEDRLTGSLVRRLEVRVGVYTLAQTRPGDGLLAALELAESVRQALHGQRLDRPEIISARHVGGLASGLMEEPGRLVCQKVLTFRYELMEDPS